MRQENGVDCGLHFLANTEQICRNSMVDGRVADVVWIPAAGVSRMRRTLLGIIYRLEKHVTEAHPLQQF